MMDSTPVVPLPPEPRPLNKRDLKSPSAVAPALKSAAGAAPHVAWQASELVVEDSDANLETGAVALPGPADKTAGKTGGMFEYMDAEAIKREVRANLLRPDPYNVCDLYKKTGIWQLIAKHPLFENITLAVIAGNAVWIAVDTDWNKESSLISSAALFQTMEHLFCIYFSGELLIRFMALQRKLDGLKDGWFVFDSLLVAMMVIETWVFTLLGEITGNKGESPLGGAAVLRLFRLLRLSRLLRMLRSLPELMILIKGMITAMKSVLYVMCLLGIILYVFAIAFTQLAIDSENIREVYFKNVLLSMYSLLIYGTFLDDLSQFCDDIRKESIPCLVLVGIFICLSALTVMNMLIGVLCEVVSAVAATEKEIILTQTVSTTMQGIVEKLDTNGNRMISLKEFKKILEIPEALRALEAVGVDPAGVVDFAEMMFFEDSDPDKPRELPFDVFMELILDLRCSNTATVKDIKYMWRQIKPKMAHLTQEVVDLNVRTERIENTMDSVLGELKKLSDSRATLGQPTHSRDEPPLFQ